MGVNIHLLTKDGIDHPDWDAFRGPGGREFAGRINGLPRTVWNAPVPFIETGEVDGVLADGPIFRPSDFARWRLAIPDEPGANERHGRMLDLLERDTSLWIYLSY